MKSPGTQTAMSLHKHTNGFDGQFWTIANVAPVPMWLSGTDRSFVFFNNEWVSFTGEPLKEGFANAWTEGIHPDDKERCWQAFSSSFDTRTKFRIQYRRKRYDGKYSWVLEHGSPKYSDDGEFRGYAGSFVEIEDLLAVSRLKEELVTMEALKTEQALNEELAAFNEELNASNEHLSVTVEKLEQTQQELADLNEALELKVSERTAQLEVNEAALQAVNEELTAINEELSATNDELIKSHERLELLVDQLASSEQKARSIVESAPFPIGVYVGREMRITLLNKAIIRVWGKGGDLIGKTYAEVLPELANTGIYDRLAEVYTTGEAYHAVNQRVDLMIEDQLQAFYFNYDFTPLFDKNGKVYGVMNTAADVTDLVNANLRAEKSEIHLYNTIMQSPVAMGILLGPHHKVNVANNRVIELWGKTREDVIGKPIFEGLPEAKGQGLEELLDGVYTTGITYEAHERAVSLMRNGRLENLYLDFVYQPYIDTSDHILGVIVTAIDVTGQVNARKEVQKLNEELASINEELTAANEEQSRANLELEELNDALKRSQDELQLAIESAGFGTWDFDPETGLFSGNDLTRDWFGVKGNEDIQLSGALKVIASEDRERVTKAIEASLTYESGGGYSIEYTLEDSYGASRIVNARGKALFNEWQRPVRFSGILMDITEQKKDEQRKNAFIGIVSHELKTPLTSLKALLQVAVQKIEHHDNPFLKFAVEKSSIQVRKMENMINGFLDISRLESGKMKIEKEIYNLQEQISEIIKEAELTVTSHEIGYDTFEPVMVYADREKIASVISNLLSNAVKYSPKGKGIEVGCIIADNCASVTFRDEGVGVNGEDKEKIFERYYRVESSNTRHISGFGIGLYLCKEIVARHNGRIWMESNANEGSTFYFTLPLHS